MGRCIPLGRSLSHRSDGVHRVAKRPLKGAWPLSCLLALLGAERPLPAQVPDIVFAARSLPQAPNPVRAAAIERASRGRLLVREASGQIRVLVDGAARIPVAGAPKDALNPDVFYDGSRILFAGY